MESTGKTARVVLFAVCSACAALALTFGLYYLREYEGKKKKGRSTNVFESLLKARGNESGSSFAIDRELTEILKENGHGELTKGTISSLLELLEKVEDHMLEKLLVALLNCSAFTTNQNIIRECGGLSRLVALLTHPKKLIIIKTVQVLSNLAMNEKNQECLKDSVFEIIKNLEYCDIIDDDDVITEHLKLMVNLSATNIAHEEVMTGAQAFFDILCHSHSETIQKEVLRLLVNLSCNTTNLEGLLGLKPLLILQTFMLADNQDDIVLRAVTIVANLLSSPDGYTEQQQAVITEHLNVLYGELMRLLDHTDENIQSQAKRALRSIFAFRMMYTT